MTTRFLRQALAVAAGVMVLAGVASAQDNTPRSEIDPFARVAKARADANKAGGDRVINGYAAAPGQYPFQVSLLVAGALDDSRDSQLNAHFCGGSLISPEWVLTAAHCLVYAGAPLQPEQLTVLTGATDLAEGERHQIAEIIVHESYDPFVMDNDLGLIRLATPAKEAPIKLSFVSDDHGPVTVTGWGRTETGAMPRNLLMAKMQLFPNDTCNAGIKTIYGEDMKYVLARYLGRFRLAESALDDISRSLTPVMGDPLTGNMICAGEPDGARDSCQGDSGGPLFGDDAGTPIQVGIVSWGEGPLDADMPCGHANAYGIYTRIANYKDWIGQHTGIQ